MPSTETETYKLFPPKGCLQGQISNPLDSFSIHVVFAIKDVDSPANILIYSII